MFKPFNLRRSIRFILIVVIIVLTVVVNPAFAVDGLGPGSPTPPYPVLNAGPTQFTWTEDLGLSNYFVRFYRISNIPWGSIATTPGGFSSEGGVITWTPTGDFPAFLAVEGAYVWDVSGSAPLYFHVDTQAPSAFNLVSPGTIFHPDSHLYPYPTLDELPTSFSWQQSTGAEYYKFRIGKLNEGGEATYDVPAAQTTVSGGVVTWTPGETAVKNILSENALYSWQALAIDDNGTPGDTGDDKTQGSPSFGFNLDISFDSPFTLTSPASGALIRGGTTFTWTPATGATNYQLVMFHYSNDVRLGEVVNVERTPAELSCEDDDATVCSYYVTFSMFPFIAFPEGKYLWNVVANDQYADTDPTNSGLTFTFNHASFELLRNSGFETQASNAAQANQWKLVNPTGERRLCTPKVPTGGSTPCAFQFTGSPTPSSISQTVKPALVKRLNIANDSLTLSFRSATKVAPAAGSVVRVIIQFKGGVSNQMVNVPIAAETVNGDFTLVSENIIVNSGTVKKIMVQVRNANTSGKFFVDDIRLILQPKAII